MFGQGIRYMKLFFNTINIKNKIDINNFIIAKANIPDLNDYVPQGIMYLKDNIYITAYNSIGGNTRLYTLNKELKHVKTSELYNNSHAGGLTYDNSNKLIWITDKKGSISGYEYKSLTHDTLTPILKRVDVSDELINIWNGKTAAYICANNKKLYVGNYNEKSKSILKEYDLIKDGISDSYRTIKFLGGVQGICFYQYENGTYLLVSRSCGKRIPSLLEIYNYDDTITDYRKEKHVTIKMNAMMEQITIMNNHLLCLFECNSRKYNKERVYNDIIKIDLNKLLETIKRDISI